MKFYIKIALSLVACFMAFPGETFAQPATAVPAPPDCVVFVQFIGDGSGTQATPTNGFDNRFLGCQTWTFVYQATATGGTLTNLTVQSAPGALTPGTWGTYGGTVNTGINPNTSNTGAVTVFSNGDVNTPWLRILLTEGTFIGTVNGVLYGYKSGYSGGGGGGGGCPDPCPVVGEEAQGAVVSENPVLTGGVDPATGELEYLRANGEGQMVQGTTPTGDVVSADSAPLLMGIVSNGAILRQLFSASANSDNNTGTNFPSMAAQLFNGVTWDSDFACINSDNVSVAATGPTEIVALGAGETIKVCNFSATVDAGGSLDVTFVYGTGTNCGTGTTTLAGPYDQITALDLWSKDAPLTVPDGNALCLTNSAGTAFTGVIVYAQY